MTRLLLIDVGSGNLRSAYSSLTRVWQESGTKGWVRVTRHDALKQARQDLKDCSHIVLPGVGSYGDCMSGLRQSGLLDDMAHAVRKDGKAFLGICVGMQLLSDKGEEGGGCDGLGWLGGVTRAFAFDDAHRHLKIPHMGWNDLTAMRPHPLWQGIKEGSHFYFVHSYYVDGDDALRLACFDYGGKYAAAIGKDNMFATQFHPEKSQRAGLQLLANFIAWNV